MSTPNRTKPLPSYLAYTCFISGNSTLQGGHHDAQKLIHTGLPLSDDSLTGWPVDTSLSTKSGASWPTLGPVPRPVMSAPVMVMGYDRPTGSPGFPVVAKARAAKS